MNFEFNKKKHDEYQEVLNSVLNEYGDDIGIKMSYKKYHVYARGKDFVLDINPETEWEDKIELYRNVVEYLSN